MRRSTDVERETGTLPRLVATSARGGPDRLAFDVMRSRLETDTRPELLVFGTGWGLTREVLDRCDDLLEPVRGTGGLQPSVGPERGVHHP